MTTLLINATFIIVSLNNPTGAARRGRQSALITSPRTFFLREAALIPLKISHRLDTLNAW